MRSFSEHVAVITDANLRAVGEKLHTAIQKTGARCHLLILPPGEHAKSFSFVEKLSRSLARLGVKRDGCLVGLGGGVVLDITGFLASIYMRGIPFISVPTTLLAMCDSSIGGKTGIDLPEGKNLIGSFYHPEHIFMDPLMLKTLPEREFRSGMAEVIKHAIIADRGLFTLLEKRANEVLRRVPTLLEQMVKRNVRIKLKIVKKDERESIRLKKAGAKDSRMLLNYGHTVGHALETLSKFRLSHGEAVAIGMVAENRIAVAKKMLREADALRIKNLLRRFHLPVEIPGEFSKSAIEKAMTQDKKHIQGVLYFALPTGIGRARVTAV